MNLSRVELESPMRIRRDRPISDEELLRLSAENEPLRLERDANGEILVMTPTGGNTGKINLRIGRLFDEWAEADGRGVAFDSSTGFHLPNGAVRSPDLAWVTNERWNALTAELRDGFAMCPDFVMELSSPSDRLPNVKKKITEEWIANGVKLAWLIDTKARTVIVYRPDEEPEVLHDPSSIQGTGPIAGFELVMARIWE
jgi:Uma2 family endonuclease